ncbi:MAG: L-aspartate oxidase [Candidatus Jordarchaeum sp.]|uniref:L-aspartate oxidase n=1 Tax=Candidatus Jordarchaeum sp. TaxID=2823881 RepID=UPI00404AD4CC
MRWQTDFLVIGSGIAGLSFALKAGNHGKVIVATKKSSVESSTNFAQGGIAAVTDLEQDNFESHIRDTLEAGCYLNDLEVVEMVVKEAPERVRELIEIGVEFERNENGSFNLGLEGGHSRRRILHVADFTGAAIERALVDACEKHPNVTIIEDAMAIDLITTRRLKLSQKEDECIGAYIFDKKSGNISTYLANVTVLATGGCGQIYLYTTNPSISTGDGIAMAYRIGARVKDLEFVQFHPTTLYDQNGSSFLISEAVRGEGGVLMTISEYEDFIKSGEKDPTKFSFMKNYDERGSLATRDIVARAVDRELKRSGDKYVYLYLLHLDSEKIKERFPHIYNTCLEYGIDITKQPIPVVPAAHYMVGGVAVNKNGQVIQRDDPHQVINRLYAIGEVAATGLHGANRLASNSLLESVVFSHRSYLDSIKYLENPVEMPLEEMPLWDATKYKPIDEKVLLKHDFDEIRRLMWKYVGIVRSDLRLQRAIRRLNLLEEDISHYYWNYILNEDLIELRNIILVARLIVEASIERKQNIGLFYNIDNEKNKK